MNLRCPHCGRDNPEHARFCMHCSGPLAQTCVKCGAALSLKAQFCSRCGTAVIASAGSVNPVWGATGRLPPATLLAARYRITRKLGQGGMAAVYLTEDLRLTGKQWAIKEMTDAALTNTTDRLEAVAAFRQEAELLAKLDHPNLPKVVDYFSENNNQYLVMEYIQGQTLEEQLTRNRGPLPESQVRVWAERLCQVLAYLHNQRPPIIFRDLKPSNIMVRTDGEVKLIDFGIARHFKPGQRKDTQAFGTMGYAPPEQHGKGQTDVRSDIYALGATLHHLLTGQDPSLNPFAFERVRRLNAAVSPTFEEAIAKAVDMKPDLRWQNMEQMRQALAIQPAVSAVAAVYTPSSLPGQGMHAVAPTVRTPQPTPPAYQPVYQPAPHLTLQSSLNYASYGKRVGAYLIDSILQLLLVLLIFVPVFLLFVGNAGPYTTQADVEAMMYCTLIPAFLLVQIFYTFRPTARTGKTMGKRLVGIRVVNKEGQPPGMGRTLIRYLLGYSIEGLVGIGFIGLLWPLWDEQKQTWHDKIAGTFVVEG